DERVVIELEPRGERRGGDAASAPDGEQQRGHAGQGGVAHGAVALAAHDRAHDQRDGDGHADGEGGPGALGQDVDHGEAHGGDGDDDGEEDGDGGDDAGGGADLFARDLGERAAVAAHAGGEDDEVVHRAADGDADQDPGEAGQEA